MDKKGCESLCKWKQIIRITQFVKKSCYSMIILVLSLSTIAPIHASAQPLTFTDTTGHWAQSYIAWAVEEHLTEGYSDGSFQPNRLINEAEFLAMLLRVYNLVPPTSSDEDAWYKNYYLFANKLNWPLTYVNDAKSFRRGQAALLMASAANGRTFTEKSAIQWLLDEHISNGRSSATVNGFVPNGKLTRAEALTFFYNLKLHSQSLSSIKLAQTNTALAHIAMNDSVQKVELLLGKPSRIDPSEQVFSWYVYNKNYSELMMFGILNDRVVALFSNEDSNWKMINGVYIGQTLSDAMKLVDPLRKSKQQDDYYTYITENVKTTLFLDNHDSSKIIGILQMNQTSLQNMPTTYTSKQQLPFEQQLFDLTNAERAQRNIPLLKWDKLAAASARAHSSDMRSNNYFSHQNTDGLSPFDRMKAKGIKYTMSAENIAAGYVNSIYAHYGWMDSDDGHREALLNSKLERIGTGVAFGGDYKIYYTQNFYSP